MCRSLRTRYHSLRRFRVLLSAAYQLGFTAYRLGFAAYQLGFAAYRANISRIVRIVIDLGSFLSTRTRCGILIPKLRNPLTICEQKHASLSSILSATTSPNHAGWSPGRWVGRMRAADPTFEQQTATRARQRGRRPALSPLIQTQSMKSASTMVAPKYTAICPQIIDLPVGPNGGYLHDAHSVAAALQDTNDVAEKSGRNPSTAKHCPLCLQRENDYAPPPQPDNHGCCTYYFECRCSTRCLKRYSLKMCRFDYIFLHDPNQVQLCDPLHSPICVDKNRIPIHTTCLLDAHYPSSSRSDARLG